MITNLGGVSSIPRYKETRPAGSSAKPRMALEALQRADELKPDLILLDIDLPTISGLEVARRIGHANAGAKILFTSQSNDPDLVSAALSNGAYGYVLKADAATELLPAIETVLRGEKFFSRRLRHSGH